MGQKPLGTAVALLVAAAAACAPPAAGPPPGAVASAVTHDGLLIRGGVLVLRDRDTVPTDVAIDWRGSPVVLRYGPTPEFAPTDTLDATGLFIHTAHAFDPAEPREGSAPLFVLREGRSPGDRAVWRLVGGPPSAVAESERRPEGPAPPLVGCWAVTGPDGLPDWAAPFLTGGLRLYWQHHLLAGREDALVATDH